MLAELTSCTLFANQSDGVAHDAQSDEAAAA